ncbi:MAG TPA: hypothetical protein ENI86_08330 [Acidimicrobiales bacterium]|nr:hypothetical protein [Acidimicrobiales bacterium]
MIHIETTPDGVRLVVKTGSGPEAERLRHEARVLAAVDHPGVVELIDVADSDGRVRLATAWIDGVDLVGEPPTTLIEVARTMAAVARTLADLHEIGIIHGDVSAEHIVVDSVGRVTLCGFSRALLSTDEAELVDLTASGGETHSGSSGDVAIHWPGPAVDLAATGALILDLVAAVPDTGNGVAIEREDLTHLGELACESAGPTPTGIDFTMAELAERLARLCPRPAPAGERADPPGRRGAGRRFAVPVAIAVGALVLVALTGGGSAVTDTIPSGPGPSDAPAAVATPPPTLRPTTTTAPTPSVAPELLASAVVPCPLPTRAMQRADIDGDGCPEGWYRTGAVLVADGVRYSIGDDDDLVTVGDWNCDGVATPALVTVPEGRVFLFPGWGGDSGSVTAVEIRSWPEPRSVAAVAGPGCDTLAVVAASGRHEVGGRR